MVIFHRLFPPVQDLLRQSFARHPPALQTGRPSPGSKTCDHLGGWEWIAFMLSMEMIELGNHWEAELLA
jgi:hypothetical protein